MEAPVFGVTPPSEPVSPLRAPVPRHPDQTTMFESPIDTTFSIGPDQPLAVSITISMRRTQRQRCTNCHNRRICYFVGLGDVITSPPMCAKCAGLR